MHSWQPFVVSCFFRYIVLPGTKGDITSTPCYHRLIQLSILRQLGRFWSAFSCAIFLLFTNAEKMVPAVRFRFTLQSRLQQFRFLWSLKIFCRLLSARSSRFNRRNVRRNFHLFVRPRREFELAHHLWYLNPPLPPDCVALHPRWCSCLMSFCRLFGCVANWRIYSSSYVWYYRRDAVQELTRLTHIIRLKVRCKLCIRDIKL